MSLRRAPQSEFSEFQKLQRVRTYIERNPILFVAGMEFDVEALTTAFGLTHPDFAGLTPEEVIAKHTSYTNKRSQWQNRFNRVLAQRGMYMTKRYNTDLWYIRDNEDVVKKIGSFSRDSLRSRARGNELRRGFAGFHNRYTASVSDATLLSIASNGSPADWSGTDYVDPETT